MVRQRLPVTIVDALMCFKVGMRQRLPVTIVDALLRFKVGMRQRLPVTIVDALLRLLGFVSLFVFVRVLLVLLGLLGFCRLSEQYAKVRELELAFDEGARRLHASNFPGMTRMCGHSLKNLERCHRLLNEELDRIFDEYESLSNISRTGKTEMNEHRLLNSGATEAREEGATGKLNCADNDDQREEEITQFGEPS